MVFCDTQSSIFRLKLPLFRQVGLQRRMRSFRCDSHHRGKKKKRITHIERDLDLEGPICQIVLAFGVEICRVLVGVRPDVYSLRIKLRGMMS